MEGVVSKGSSEFDFSGYTVFDARFLGHTDLQMWSRYMSFACPTLRSQSITQSREFEISFIRIEFFSKS
jgi:hypothetical protein